MASVFLLPAVSLTLWTSASAQAGLSICRRPADADAETAAMAAAQHCIDAASDRLASSPGASGYLAEAVMAACIEETDRLALATLHCQPAANYVRLLEQFKGAAHDRAAARLEQVRAATARAGVQP